MVGMAPRRPGDRRAEGQLRAADFGSAPRPRDRGEV